MAILTVRPEPKYDESLLGYLLRLAKCNGLQSTRELLSLCQIHNIPTHPRPTFISYGRLINGISDATGVSVEKLCLAFNTPQLTALYDKHRYIRHLDTFLFQCCPLCMTEEPYHRAEWLSQFSTICHKHNVELIDTCPKCHKRFGWHNLQLHGCCNCGTQFCQIMVEKIHPYPFEVAVSQGIDKVELLISTLCKVICHVLNNDDLMFTSISGIEMGVTTRRQLLHFAYQLLIDSDLRESYCSSPSRQNISHDGMQLFDWLNRLALNGQKMAASCPIFERNAAHVSTHRLRAVSSCHVPLNRQVGIEEAAFLLKVPLREMWSIVRSGDCIKSLTSGKLYGNILIDYAVLVELQTRLINNASPANCMVNDPVCLRRVIQHLIPLFYGDLNAVIGAILNEKLASYRSESCRSWQDTQVQRTQVVRLLQSRLEQCDDQNISLSELAKLLCVEESTAAAFVRWTPVKYARWSKAPAISLPLVVEFLHRHVVLNRYCNIYDIDIRQATPLLRNVPVEFPELRDVGCIILSKNATTDALLNGLRQI